MKVKDGHNPFLLVDWFVVFDGVSIDKTIVNISEPLFIGGHWAAGAPLKYKQRLDKLTFYTFKNNCGKMALYWQPDPLTYHAVLANPGIWHRAG